MNWSGRSFRCTKEGRRTKRRAASHDEEGPLKVLMPAGLSMVLVIALSIIVGWASKKRGKGETRRKRSNKEHAFRKE